MQQRPFNQVSLKIFTIRSFTKSLPTPGLFHSFSLLELPVPRSTSSRSADNLTLCFTETLETTSVLPEYIINTFGCIIKHLPILHTCLHLYCYCFSRSLHQLLSGLLQAPPHWSPYFFPCPTTVDSKPSSHSYLLKNRN